MNWKIQLSTISQENNFINYKKEVKDAVIASARKGGCLYLKKVGWKSPGVEWFLFKKA